MNWLIGIGCGLGGCVVGAVVTTMVIRRAQYHALLRTFGWLR